MHQIVCRLGELTALPKPPSCILVGLFLREGRKGGRERREEEEKEGKGKGGEGIPLLSRYTPARRDGVGCVASPAESGRPSDCGRETELLVSRAQTRYSITPLYGINFN